MSEPLQNPKITASYYQQFDADFNLDVPAESFGGWKTAEIPVSLEHTAVVLMHAWDNRKRTEYPGWHRSVEYVSRGEDIYKTVFPKLTSAVRRSGMKLFHVVAGSNYYEDLPGYKMVVELAGPTPEPPERIASDLVSEKLSELRYEYTVGTHNKMDMQRGFRDMDFHPCARPLDDEGIAKNEHQLFALCKKSGINHLIYAGFAVNWCLLSSPGGMRDMQKRGFVCSVFRDAVTAVENKETARKELNKASALWFISLVFGFIFNVDDFIIKLGDNK